MAETALLMQGARVQSLVREVDPLCPSEDQRPRVLLLRPSAARPVRGIQNTGWGAEKATASTTVWKVETEVTGHTRFGSLGRKSQTARRPWVQPRSQWVGATASLESSPTSRLPDRTGAGGGQAEWSGGWRATGTAHTSPPTASCPAAPGASAPPSKAQP